ncbi:MAG: sulfurtransferase TusA family protein [Myxococcales bacterium]|nr:sulfurtransferase TusA family protein [Myxococcales bacterium]
MRGELTVDALGKRCPLPIIELAKASRRAGDGVVIRLLADDPAVERDVRAWCVATGNRLLRVEVDGGVYRAYVKVSQRTRA